MNTNKTLDAATNAAWFWCAFPALTMSLGWMLRGYIGGGSLGAMIPGAMIGLALCLLLRRNQDAGTIAALAAIGVGFGGQETYGQTVGLALKPETFHWAILGFFIKGAAWGLLGGAFLGLAFSRDSYSIRDLLTSFGLMVVGTYAGWKLVNQPKLIYFSDRVVKPREELWMGLIAGAMLLLLYLAARSKARLVHSFALWGLLGGGVGFALGAAAQVWGRANAPDFPFGWWKFMEMTFGALLGLSFGFAAWLNRKMIQPNNARSDSSPLAVSLGLALVASVGTIYPESVDFSRLNFTIIGAILLAVALLSNQFSWHLAITTTYCAFAIDLLKHKPNYHGPTMWMLVLASTAVVATYVHLRPRPYAMLLLLCWTSTGVGLLKSFLPPVGGEKSVLMEFVFVLFAIGITVAARRLGKGCTEEQIVIEIP